jgi:voltage-gated potassium channel
LSSDEYILLFGIISPTFFIAKWLKSRFSKNKVIRRLNWLYFIFSILCILVAFRVFNFSLPTLNESRIIPIILSICLLSRCSEIFYAFLIDAYDKVSEPESVLEPRQKPKLRFKPKNNVKRWWHIELGNDRIEMHHRIVLALRSYIELICNFSVLYVLLPTTSWKDLCEPLKITDGLYFSGVTITTLGYGDITPTHWFSKFLSVYEVFCGVTLLVVCFAVYLSRKSN